MRREEAAAQLSAAVSAYLTAFLLWLLLLAVFLPAAELHAEPRLQPLVAAAFLLGIALEVYRGTASLLRFLDAAGAGRAARFAAYELAIAIDAALLAPALHAVSPALGGAALAVAALLGALLALSHADVVVAALMRGPRRPQTA